MNAMIKEPVTHEGKQWSFNSLYSYWTCSYNPAV